MFITLKQKVMFFRQLATFIDAGFGFGKALEHLEKNSPYPLNNVIKDMGARFLKGASIYECFKAHNKVFDNFTLEIINAAERGGMLDVKLRDLADFFERWYAFRLDFIMKMLYPLLIFHASIFIPTVTVWIEKGPTAYMKATFGTLLIIYAIVILTLVIINFLRNTRATCIMIDTIIAYTPAIGAIVRKLSLMRFMAMFSDLYEAALPLSQCIIISARSCGNFFLAKKFIYMVEKIDKGTNLLEAFIDTGLFPPLVTHLLASGEVTGNISMVLKKASDFLEQEFKATMLKVAIIVPTIMLLVMAVVVAMKLVSFYSNLYKGFLP